MFTKIKNPKLLIAGHIKPWAKSDNFERLDRYNGFPLTPTYDKLFGEGYISFDSSGKLLISSVLSNIEIDKFKLDEKFKLKIIDRKQIEVETNSAV